MASLDQIKAEAARLSAWAHLATVGADGDPDVVPVHPAWEGDVLWVMAGGGSTKARNIRHHPRVALHYQVDERGDGVELWGTATIHDDLETKRRLWTGHFDYDLNAFAPGGPEGSPDMAFIAIQPERAVVVKQYGMGGIEHWKRAAGATDPS